MSMWFRCLLWFLPFLLGGVEIRYFPTYENCSVRVARAEQVKKISLQYRAAGERVWLAAPMVVRLHDPERVYEWERPVKLNMPYQNGEWRGNITGLRENTRYETRWQIDGTVYSGSFRTADSQDCLKHFFVSVGSFDKKLSLVFFVHSVFELLKL